MIQMTIQVPSALTNRHDLFVVRSRLGGQTNFWFGEVAK
jgi:hypothetical protein